MGDVSVAVCVFSVVRVYCVGVTKFVSSTAVECDSMRWF